MFTLSLDRNGVDIVMQGQVFLYSQRWEKNKRIKSLKPFLSKNVICSEQEGKLILILLRQKVKHNSDHPRGLGAGQTRNW